MNILEFIPLGRENAVTRDYLVNVTGHIDRVVRREIEEERRRGTIILNDGTGYYRSNDLDDIYREYLRETARALSILETRKTIRKKLKEAGYPVKK